MHHRLARAWSPVGHLNGVMNGDELRAAYNACLPLLTAYHTELAQNEQLCAAYQRVMDQEGARLEPAQRKLLDNALRDFRLAGVSLPADHKQRFGEVMERLATAQAKFDENVLDATNAWSRLTADEAELAGLPGTTVQRARQAAEAAGQGRLAPVARRPELSGRDDARPRPSRCVASSTKRGSRAHRTEARTPGAGTTHL